MTVQVEPLFLSTLSKYGAFDISSCFNCGNCTAVCPLSKDSDSFPRKIIRYGQIGARDRVLGSKEIWSCYYCGECSQTCPRQAEPGEYMASARRYAIARCDPTGISRLLYTSKWFAAIFLSLLSAFLILFLLSGAGPMAVSSPKLFEYLRFDVIHDTGLVILGVAALAMIVGVLRLVLGIAQRNQGVGDTGGKSHWVARLVRASIATALELSAQKNLSDCEQEPKVPWYVGRRCVHLCIMWGFIGLGLATGIDYLLGIVADKVPGQPDPLWYPPRLIGTVAGLFMVYGVTVAIVQRMRRPEKYFNHTLHSDWIFLWLLFLTGITGFVVELGVYLPQGMKWMYLVFLVHVVLGMEVVILLPFTKLAHAVYRPLGLLATNYYSAATQK